MKAYEVINKVKAIYEKYFMNGKATKQDVAASKNFFDKYEAYFIRIIKDDFGKYEIVLYEVSIRGNYKAEPIYTTKEDYE